MYVSRNVVEARRAYEQQAWFRRLCRFRVACEAEISRLKRRYGLGRVRTRGYHRVKTWVGWSFLAYNLVVAAGLWPLEPLPEEPAMG